MGQIEDAGTVELAGVCGHTVEDGCDSLLMPVCGSVEVGNPMAVEWATTGTLY